jgi:hypothetical protein
LWPDYSAADSFEETNSLAEGLVMRRRKAIRKIAGKTQRRQSHHRHEARLRGFAAINRVKRGKSKSLSAAARAEGTTLRTIEKRLPAAVYRDAKGRIRVKAGDPYSEWVEIMTDLGPLNAKARGSRQRELAGRHRAVWMKVLRRDLPPSALEEFRGKTVGGHELLSDSDRLFTLAKGGELDQLDVLYVSPETHG